MPIQRLDLTLTVDKPVDLAGTPYRATLLRSERVMIPRAGGGMDHRDRSVIRFEREGTPPVDLTFGPEGIVHPLGDVKVAVFGGQVLTVFPPGEPVRP